MSAAHQQQPAGNHHLPQWIMPSHPVGLVVLTVIAGLILQVASGQVPWLNWLATPVPAPLWAVVAALLLVGWFAALRLASLRKPVFFEGAYYAATDRDHAHAYCMHCWEHQHQLVTVGVRPNRDGGYAFECVTHPTYYWPTFVPESVVLDI